LLSEFVVKRFGQEPYPLVQQWIKRLLDFGLCYPADLNPDLLGWFRGDFATQAATQVSESDARVRAAVLGLNLFLGAPAGTSEYWAAIEELLKAQIPEKVLLDALSMAPLTTATKLFPLIEAAKPGAGRTRLLQCLMGIKDAEVERAVRLFSGPTDQDTAIILARLASSARRQDLEPKILRYQSGEPVYEDVTHLMELWRDKPPRIPPLAR
jgi:hypothetical protein